MAKDPFNLPGNGAQEFQSPATGATPEGRNLNRRKVVFRNPVDITPRRADTEREAAHRRRFSGNDE